MKEYSSRPHLETKEFDPKSVALVTATYYGDYKGYLDVDNPTSLTPEQIADTATIRGNLALKTFREAAKNGYNVFVSEGGSNELFLKNLRQIPGITVMKRPKEGRAVARRQGYEAAAQTPGVGVTVWLEPEKYTLLSFIPQIVQPILNNETDIVVIGREEKVFKDTWPPYMWESESRANRKFNSILQEFDLLPQDVFMDMWAGPRAFRNRPDIVKLWTEVYEYQESESPTGPSIIRKHINPEQYSNGQFFPVIEALNLYRLNPKTGPRVTGVKIAFPYPEIQLLSEMAPSNLQKMMSKRKGQRVGFLAEEIQYIRYLSNPTGPKTKLHLVNSESGE